MVGMINLDLRIVNQSIFVIRPALAEFAILSTGQGEPDIKPTYGKNLILSPSKVVAGEKAHLTIALFVIAKQEIADELACA